MLAKKGHAVIIGRFFMIRDPLQLSLSICHYVSVYVCHKARVFILVMNLLILQTSIDRIDQLFYQKIKC